MQFQGAKVKAVGPLYLWGGVCLRTPPRIPNSADNGIHGWKVSEDPQDTTGRQFSGSLQVL